MTTWTQPVISLDTCGNFQGSVYFYCVNNGMVVKWRCFTELTMPDSIIQCLEAAATNKNMDTGIKFYNHDLQPFEVDDIDGNNVKSSSSYKDIPAEMPGVTIGKNNPATPIHGASDILDYFPESAIAAADNAGLEDPQLASADPGIVVTNAESDDEDNMDDEHSFTLPANYHDPGLDEDHRSDNDSSAHDQTPDQDQIKLEKPDEIDEYNEPETS